MSTIAVIIPAKNEELVLPNLLTALQVQTLRPDEIVVSDGGSTDATRAIAEKFGVKVVQGGSAAIGRNAGAVVTKSEYLMFLDADAILENENFVGLAIAEFKNNNLDLATADVMVSGGTMIDKMSFAFYNWYVRIWASRRPHPIGTFILTTRQAFDAVGGFNPEITYAEDQDFGLRVKQIGKKFAVLNDVNIGINTRRQDRIGRVRFIILNILAELHILVFGAIKERIFLEQYNRKK